MKFLLDVNLPPSFGTRLYHLGHEAVHSGKLGLSKATDEDLLSFAESHGMVLITHDLDFGQLMAFSQKRKPSIVIFRVQKLGPAMLERLLVRSWNKIDKPLLDGAIVVVGEKDFRIRLLPIGGTDFKSHPTAYEAPGLYRMGKARGKKRAHST